MAIFKKSGEEPKAAWGVADPAKRQFLAGLFLGIAIGVALGRFLV